MGSSLVLACIAAVLSLSSGVDAITRADCDKMSSDTLKQKCFQLVARSSGGSDSESSGGSGGGVTGSFSHDGGTTLAGSGGSYTMGSGGGGAGGGTESGGGLLSGTGSGSFGRSGSGSGSKGSTLVLGGSSDDSTGKYGVGGLTSGSESDKDKDKKCWDKLSSSWKKTCSGGWGDPVLFGFTGRSFNFNGTVGKIYNLVSSKNHQMSTKLKPAPMWNHVGTDMEGIAIMYKSYRVLMELDGDTPKVYINDKQLETKKHIQKHAWHFEDGTAVEVEWDMYKPTIGNAVTVTTDMMKVMMWHTPAGIIDEGGATLVGYLNFNITLISAPENNVMSGVIGDTYERFNVGMEAYNPNSTYYLPEDSAWHGKGELEDYEMKSYWDTNFKMNTFGKDIVEIQDRSSLEIDVVPLVDLPATASSTRNQPARLTSRGGGLLRQRRLLL